MKGLYRIRASAGSGKTHRLTGQFLEMLAGLNPSAPGRGAACALADAEGTGRSWAEVMGVTFTNAAAQEMKERVLSSLKKIALGLERNPENLHGWTRESALPAVDELLRHYDELNLRTIDSLLHLVVRQSALELELPPDFETTFDNEELFGQLVEDMADRAREAGEESDLYTAFVKACREELAYGDVQGFLAGERVRGRVAELLAWMLPMVDEGKADFLETLLRTASSSAMSKRLDTMLKSILKDGKILYEMLAEEGLKPTSGLMKALAALPVKLDPARPATVKDLTSVFLREEREIDAGQECVRRLDRLREQIGQAKTTYAVFRDALRLAPFLDLAILALAELPEYQNETGLLPASRIPALAARVLNGEYGVAESLCRMGTRLEHILIDEFQDTSLAQWKALEPLAREVLSRGGSVSLIGDVKQSIYHWRGGESSLFENVPRDLADILDSRDSDNLASLEYNWRSRRGIIDWNNDMFSALADKATAWAVLDALVPKSDTYAHQEPLRQDLLDSAAELLAGTFADVRQRAPAKAPEGGLITLLRLPSVEESGEEEGDDILKRLVPEKVREIAGRTGSWSSVCVLTRTTSQSEKATAWLLDQHIPVLTRASLLLAEQPVIAQSVALMKFLSAQDDDISFWTVLEGEELLPPAPARCWGERGLPASRRVALRDWAAGLSPKKKGEGRPLAQHFAVDFPELWTFWFAPLTRSAGLYTPYDTICALYRRWKVWERNPRANGFIRRFLEILHVAESQGMADMGSFLQWWNEEGVKEKAPLPKNMDAVQVMSIHSAKGLAFDAVLLPWLNFSVGKLPPGAQYPPEVCETGGLTVLGRRIRALGRPWLEATLEEARESIHLFYVACTRAVSELHCFLPPEEEHPKGMNAVLELLMGPLLETMSADERNGWRRGDASGLSEGGPSLSVPQPEEDAAPDTEAADGEEAWLPMAWLPRLRIFRSPLEEWAGWVAPGASGASSGGEEGGSFSLSARQRGILAHLCLEMMQTEELRESRKGGDLRQAVRQAVKRAMLRFPLPVRGRSEVAAELEDMLIWYASLPESGEWLRLGSPEQSLIDREGRLRRVDLLVDGEDALIAVEYKSGGDCILPVPAHERQLRSYMEALAADTDKAVRGVLVYLDRRKLFHFGGGA